MPFSGTRPTASEIESTGPRPVSSRETSYSGPGALLKSSTPAAPAANAFSTLVLAVHWPRGISAMPPDAKSAKSSEMQPSEICWATDQIGGATVALMRGADGGEGLPPDSAQPPARRAFRFAT